MRFTKKIVACRAELAARRMQSSAEVALLARNLKSEKAQERVTQFCKMFPVLGIAVESEKEHLKTEFFKSVLALRSDSERDALVFFMNRVFHENGDINRAILHVAYHGQPHFSPLLSVALVLEGYEFAYRLLDNRRGVPGWGPTDEVKTWHVLQAISRFDPAYTSDAEKVSFGHLRHGRREKQTEEPAYPARVFLLALKESEVNLTSSILHRIADFSDEEFKGGGVQDFLRSGKGRLLQVIRTSLGEPPRSKLSTVVKATDQPSPVKSGEDPPRSNLENVVKAADQLSPTISRLMAIDPEFYSTYRTLLIVQLASRLRTFPDPAGHDSHILNLLQPLEEKSPVGPSPEDFKTIMSNRFAFPDGFCRPLICRSREAVAHWENESKCSIFWTMAQSGYLDTCEEVLRQGVMTDYRGAFKGLVASTLTKMAHHLRMDESKQASMRFERIELTQYEYKQNVRLPRIYEQYKHDHNLLRMIPDLQTLLLPHLPLTRYQEIREVVAKGAIMDLRTATVDDKRQTLFCLSPLLTPPDLFDQNMLVPYTQVCFYHIWDRQCGRLHPMTFYAPAGHSYSYRQTSEPFKALAALYYEYSSEPSLVKWIKLKTILDVLMSCRSQTDNWRGIIQRITPFVESLEKKLSEKQ